MKVTYRKLLDKLKKENITQKEFKANAKISSGTMVSIVNDKSVTTDTICRICDYFQCMPDEIMEFIPDADYDEKRKAKTDLEAQIAELQAKLKTM